MSIVDSAPLILGIESSCDETAAAVVDGARRVRSSIIASQIEEHARFGGVVPEIAARAHLLRIEPVVRAALADAGVTLADLDGVAATCGPGLIGGVIVGATFGKALALATGRPFIGVNHLEGHALTGRLTDDVAFHFLLLLVSGGHCQILRVAGVGRYRLMGSTLDDAAGEAFDKTAKLLGLGFPGGPAVEAAARDGDPARFALPRPLVGRAGCDFSFSGLKTAVRAAAVAIGADGTRQDAADLAAAFQMAVADVMADRVANALDMLDPNEPGVSALVVAGGVAANRLIGDRLALLAAARDLPLVRPPLALCTDNAAMIAWAGVERFRLGLTDGLDLAPRPRWPLDPEAA